MDIFVIHTSEAKNITNEMLSEFQHKNFTNETKRVQHCFTYLMLDRILKEVYHIKDREIIFEGNKPLLKSNEKYFSISHSENHVAIAVSDFECGIDIEKIKQRDFHKIAERMKFECNNLQEFYQEWTLYEAKYKLGNPPQSHWFAIIKDYFLCVASKNPNEKFELYYREASQ